MSDTHEAPPPVKSSPPRWRLRLSRLDLRSRVRWFVAEFLVVVTGILVALALNSWWQGRQNSARERAYLHQLHADLLASERQLEAAAGFFREHAHAAAKVSHAFWRSQRPAEDSLVRWLWSPLSSARVRPVLGTARALVSSGDLDLIRSDSIRSGVLDYIESVEAHLEDIRRFDETYYREGILALAPIYDVRAVVERIYGAEIDRECGDGRQGAFPSPLGGQRRQLRCGLQGFPSGERRAPFPLDSEALLGDRRVYVAYGHLLTAHRSQADEYEEMLEETRALRRRVGGALDPP